MPDRRQFIKLAGAGAAASLLSTGGVSAAEGQAAAVKSVPPRTIHLGLASYSTREYSLDETLEIADRVGLRYICLKSCHLPLDSSPKQIAEAATKVRSAGMDLYGCGVIYMRKPEDVANAFEYAKAGGMRVIVGVPEYDLLPLVNKKIKQYGISVAIHNHGPEDKLYPTAESAYKKIEKFDRRFGLCIDIGHTARNGLKPAKVIERFGDRLIDVHIRDISIATAEGKAVESGRGVIDLPAVVEALVKMRFSGVTSFEYTKDPKDIVPGLAESVGYVRGVLATLRSKRR